MLKYRIQFVLLRIAGALFRALPRRAALCAGWFIFVAALPLVRKRVREAERRLRLVFGDTLTERQVRRAARVSLRNIVFNAVETLRVDKFALPELQSIFTDLDETVAKLRAISSASDGRGVIVALPHCGNWDLAGSACYLSGLPIFSVAGKQRNPYINDLVNRRRGGHGMDIIERGGGALRQILSRLASGEMFAILPDTRCPTPDLHVPFLGGDANVARGMAAFAWQVKVPVLPIVVRRVGWTRFDIKVFSEITPDFTAPKENELRRITFEVMAIIDREIRATPEQWFWYNKRWILDPVT